MPKGVYPRNELHREICRKAGLGRTPWNKGTKGLIKPNKGSFGYGQKGHTEKHTEESRKKMSLAIKSAWDGGAFDNRPKISKETKDKIRKTLMTGGDRSCLSCGKLFYAPKSSRSNYCCWECLQTSLRKRIRITQSKYPHKHLKTKEYKDWRISVFERDKYACCICGVSGVFLHPHHKVSYTHYPDVRYDINNGITLCVNCHKDVHRNS